MAHQYVKIEDQVHTRAQLPKLTEEQIVCIITEQYMGEAQKECFRTLLVAMEKSLEARSRVAAAEIAVDTSGTDPVDRASAEEEQQLAIGGRVRDAAQILQVRAALRRIDADEFGWCMETGDMIGVGRLLVCPTTMFCVEAQQRRESKTSRFRS